jgi:hypothetical protein
LRILSYPAEQIQLFRGLVRGFSRAPKEENMEMNPTLKDVPVSFLLKLPDYGFLIIFPFTVCACFTIPLLLKKGTAAKA